MAKISTLVLQPTPFCNINCRYCYLAERANPQRMQPETLFRIFESVFSSPLLGEELTIIWHAGEPLVVPLDFYRQAFTYIERLNTRPIRVLSTFQTNGMLITQEWCDFLKAYAIHIGVSLDGPQHIHDRARIDRAGRGTFERALRGIKLLQANGIQPSILMVLSAYALAYPDEIWHFFKEHQLPRISFNVEEINGVHRRSSLDRQRDIERYKRFLRRLLELWEMDEERPTIREINTSLRNIRQLSGPIFAPENTSGAILTFDYQGNLSTFASELLGMTHPRLGTCTLGNIFDAPLEALLEGSLAQALSAEVQRGVARCQESCEYFLYCGGGSPANKLSEHGTFDATETLQCQFRIQATIDTMMTHLEQSEQLEQFSRL